jgi:hypothetical protein
VTDTLPALADRVNKDDNIICEAFGCYQCATTQIKVNAGKFGTISVLKIGNGREHRSLGDLTYL